MAVRAADAPEGGGRAEPLKLLRDDDLAPSSLGHARTETSVVTEERNVDPPLVEPIEDSIGSLDRAHARVGAAHLELLRRIAEVDRAAAWVDDGARDLAHWMAMRYGIAEWKARRWIAAARAMEDLPDLARALEQGLLGIDKVVEVARFATPATVGRLIGWARRVSVWAIRRRGEVLRTGPVEVDADAHRDRSVAWWFYDQDRRFGMYVQMPGAEGAVVARALEREARRVPAMPGEGDRAYPNVDARRADALLALCSARISADPDPDRATVVVHTTVDALSGDGSGGEVENGPVVHAETVRRRLCTSRVQVVLENSRGEPLRLGRATRVPSAGMVRLVRHRDGGCRFPGCGSRAFTEVHHVVPWERGGRTDLQNLALVCSFHHRLAHEVGWSVKRMPGGDLWWFRPNGRRYRAGPGPPDR